MTKKRLEPIDLPRRRAHALDRWNVAYHRERGQWYAEPSPAGVWATIYRRQVFFSTLVAAGDYARSRSHT